MCILHCGLVIITDFNDHLSSHPGQSETPTSTVHSDAVQVKTEPIDNDSNPPEIQARSTIYMVKVRDISTKNTLAVKKGAAKN